MAESKNDAPGRGLLSWVCAVAGWLVCAGFCLYLTLELEQFPNAYDILFPAVLLILFGNILVFLFISSRWARDARRLLMAVIRVCLGEGLLLAGMYALAKYAIGN